jgi:peptidyl-prolyl cis-trans isomerase SurA
MMLSSREVDEHVRANAAARWKQIATNPKLNEEFQKVLQQRGVKTKEQAQAVQKEFVMAKQRAMIEQLRTEARSRVRGSVVKQARDEIIEEKLKLQAAKKLGITVPDAEVDGMIRDMAKRNNKSEKEFAQMLAGMGVDIKTMKSRIRAGVAWRDVIRRKFGHQIAIGTLDVERAIASSGTAAIEGGEKVELQLQRVILPFGGTADDKAKARQLADAEGLRRKAKGCKAFEAAAKGMPGAKFENLGARPATSLQEPTRSIVLAAKVGDVTPPSYTNDGIEVYAVCNRQVAKAGDQKREEVARELQNREFELLARRYLKDLRQEADIEYR